MHLAGILVIALIVLIVILMTGQKSGYKISPFATESQGNKEEFGDVLGTLGDYDRVLASAGDQIRQSDPSKRLQPNNDWNAGLYVQSTLTSMQKAGIPPQEPVTITSKCKDQCKSIDPLASQKCEGQCYCRNSSLRYCDIQCAYTDEPRELCMRGCLETKLTNCNNFSWGFANH